MSNRLSLRPISTLFLAALFVLPCKCFTHAQTSSSSNGTTLQAGALSVSAGVSDHHFAGLQVHDTLSRRTLNVHEDGPHGARARAY
jgi:hypothetical protein